MAYLIFILIAIALFTGFLALTRYEARRGMRIFAHQRARFDAEAERLVFIATHVDFPTYVNGALRALAARVAHDLAHASLLFVRFIERLLTRAVRTLRLHQDPPATPGATTSEFVTTIKDFKNELRNGRKIES